MNADHFCWMLKNGGRVVCHGRLYLHVDSIDEAAALIEERIAAGITAFGRAGDLLEAVLCFPDRDDLGLARRRYRITPTGQLQPIPLGRDETVRP